MIVRDATATDLPVIRDLYNALIRTTTVAWSESLQTLEQRTAWFESQRERGFPVVVAEEGGEVVGFAAYGDFRGAGKWPATGSPSSTRPTSARTPGEPASGGR